MSKRTPFDDLCELLSQLPAADVASAKAVTAEFPVDERAAQPSFGQHLAWLASWQGKPAPAVKESHLCIFVSSYAGAGKLDEAIAFSDHAGRGETKLNHLCKDRGLGLRVLELAPSMPHVPNTWSERECMAACAFGMEATAAGGDLLGLSALAPGSGDAAQRFIQAIDNEYNEADALSTLSAKALIELMIPHAGREIAAMVGAIIAARSRRLPVLLEGWSAIAAAYLLWRIEPMAVGHVKIASVECEAQRDVVLKMNKSPVISALNDIAPGSGVALAVSVLAPLTALM